MMSQIVVDRETVFLDCIPGFEFDDVVSLGGFGAGGEKGAPERGVVGEGYECGSGGGGVGFWVV